MALVPPPGPQRALAASNFVFTVGSGLYLTAGVLYFTEAVHLPAGQVGLGLGIAGAVALGLGVAVGHLADRLGARRVYAVTLLVQAAATAAFVLVDGFTGFVVAVGLATGAKAAGIAARSPLIRHYGGDRPQEFRAYLRAVSNLGISLGALFAGWAVQVGTSTAYDLMVAGIVLGTLGSAALLVAVPSLETATRAKPAEPAEPAEPAKPAELTDPANSANGAEPAQTLKLAGRVKWGALGDRRYLLLTGLDGVMAIQFKVLTVAIPLWILQHTRAPRGLISVTMLTCTIMVVLFQVRASRGVDTPEAGGRAYRRAGFAFLAACAVIGLTSGVPAGVASVLLVVAVVIHTLGELWHAAGGFEVSFAFAPPHATGQYLGVFGLGAGLAEAIGPGLLIALCISWGRPGWYVVGALLAAIGALVPWAVRSAVRGDLTASARGRT